MTPLETLQNLMPLAKRTAHHLTNCTDDPAEAPYLTDDPDSMEARHEVAEQATGDGPDWDDFDIHLNISDDCQFCTVHGFEGQAQWDTAEAIANAGPVILGLINALPDLLAVATAADALVAIEKETDDYVDNGPTDHERLMKLLERKAAALHEIRHAVAKLTTPQKDA